MKIITAGELLKKIENILKGNNPRCEEIRISRPEYIIRRYKFEDGEYSEWEKIGIDLDSFTGFASQITSPSDELTDSEVRNGCC